MVNLGDILKQIPGISGVIKDSERIKEYREECKAKKKEIESKIPEIRKRILTISPEQVALMQGKNANDYEPVGIQAISPNVRDAEYAMNYAMANLFDRMNRDGIEFVVSTHFETTTSGTGSTINPTTYQTVVYGTGMKLRE